MAEKSDFVGVWKLVSYIFTDADGNVSYPYGSGGLGYISYTPEGYMSVEIMQPGRPPFNSADALGGTQAERAQAMDTYFSYTGTYAVEGDQVVHHVELSLIPNWTGVDQRRFYRFEGRRLTLSTAPMLLRGKIQVAQLIWERV